MEKTYFSPVMNFRAILLLTILINLPSALAYKEPVPEVADSPTVAKVNIQPWAAPRYQVIKKALLEKPCDILFVGDSITEQWEFVGKKVWEQKFIPLKAVNFGCSGDRTEHVLWRFEDSKLATTTPPKVCVLTIGTNNIGFWKEKQKTDEMVKGVKKIALTLLDKFPQTHLIIMETFPYGTDPKAPLRKTGEELDKEIRNIKLPRTTILGINDKFLNPDKTFKEGVFRDQVHLTEKGYQIWAEQLLPVVQKYLSETK